MDSQDYLEITISIDPFSEMIAEIIEAEISDLGFDAFQYEDPQLKAYIQAEDFNKDELIAALERLSKTSGFTFSIYVEKMPQVNWNATWEQEGFTAIIVDDRVTVRPETDLSICTTQYEVKLEAGMAFGTGHHHTTYMMMQTMLSIEDKIKGSYTTDLGCGTGVLGILAAKMGAGHVDAIDIDAVAARSTEKNIERNNVQSNTSAYCSDASLLKNGSTDVLLANIHRNIIIEDLHLYKNAVRENGYLLVSGFYTSDIEDIVMEAGLNGFHADERTDNPWIRERDGWACLRFKKFN